MVSFCQQTITEMDNLPPEEEETNMPTLKGLPPHKDVKTVRRRFFAPHLYRVKGEIQLTIAHTPTSARCNRHRTDKDRHRQK